MTPMEPMTPMKKEKVIEKTMKRKINLHASLFSFSLFSASFPLIGVIVSLSVQSVVPYTEKRAPLTSEVIDV